MIRGNVVETEAVIQPSRSNLAGISIEDLVRLRVATSLMSIPDVPQVLFLNDSKMMLLVADHEVRHDAHRNGADRDCSGPLPRLCRKVTDERHMRAASDVRS
jgi:hypothetical protein